MTPEGADLVRAAERYEAACNFYERESAKLKTEPNRRRGGWDEARRAKAVAQAVLADVALEFVQARTS